MRVEAREQVVVGHDARRRLRRSSSLANGARPAGARIAGRSSPVGLARLDRRGRVVDRGAGDLAGLRAGERRLVARRGSGGRRGRRRPPRAGRSTSSTNVASRSTSPAIPEAAERPPGRSRGSWRSSPRRSRRARAASRSRRTRDLVGAGRRRASCTTSSSGGGAPASTRASPLLGLHEPLADALAQLARGHAREGDEQELVERVALGDVARGERGDRVRLAGAGARLEHGHAGRQRAADVEAARISAAVAHSSASSAAHSRRARRPKRAVDACQPRSSAARRRASSVEACGSPPKTSRCSGSRSSSSKRARTPTLGGRPCAARRRWRPPRRTRRTSCRRAAAARASRGRRGRRARRGTRARSRAGLESSASGPTRATRRPALAARPTVVTASKPRSGWAAVSASSRTHAASRWRGFDARVRDRRAAMSPPTPETVPLSMRPSASADADVDGAEVASRVEQRLGARRRSSSTSGSTCVDHRLARARPGGSVPRAISASDRGLRASAPVEPRVQQPLADAPLLEAVELDRQRVLDLVGVVGDADAEPLAQERAHRAAATKRTRSSSSTTGPAAARQRRRQERRRRRGARRSSASRAVRARRRRSSRLRRRPQLARGEVARVERLQRMRDDDAVAGAPSGTATVRSTTSSSSPTGTAGGRGAFVRSSLPV